MDLLDRAIRCHGSGDRLRLAALLSRGAAEAVATDRNAEAADDYDQARLIYLDAGVLLSAAAVVPGLVSARHLLGEPLAARLALVDQGLQEIKGSADGAREQQ